ncbi:uncharacterized protein KQ657_001691 [Scheffersomyces spartinae]|uniref:F-box domain-containing protein n=1 Tax=Scheffersomyces spartinae TaxID=45513 RepID=A0A9P7V813_9ASCO|nr:uncharacterized protein KQ657_001691 [Scheffersomyces spartinae]KAG7192591.1 hypothetical protein KQ657_001691 [Scheffersomyces spartinae]
MQLQDLPEKVLDNVLFFLGQNDVRNLALTNYHYYRPCQRKLYSRIVIIEDQVLGLSNIGRLMDFMHSQVTFLYGYSLKKHQAYSLTNQYKLIWAKLEALIQSMQINIELIEFVKEIYILGTFNSLIVDSLRKLVSLIQSVSSNKLQVIHASSFEVRKNLKIDYAMLPYATELIIDSLNLPETSGITSVRITRHCPDVVGPIDKDWLRLLKQLSSLIVSPTSFDCFFIELLRLNNGEVHPLRFSSLLAFRLVITKTNLALINKLVPLLVKVSKLEIVFRTANFDVIEEAFTALVPLEGRITHLSIIQDTPEFSNHSRIETFELEILNFIKSLPNLKLLYMRLWIPEESMYRDDGVDGNYLRRLKFYRELLPSGFHQKVTLILPNLVSSLASYEQAMNTVLWNGCKCQHCLNYLDYIDEYLFTHQYYNDSQDCFKDIVSSHVVSSIGQYLSQRMIVFNNPDIMDEFEDIHDHVSHRKHDHYEGDIFYDAENEMPLRCFFDEHVFNHNYGICISHYVNDLVRSLLRLHRGDAESRYIHELETTDGENFHSLKFNKVIINGINYVLNRELNNTAFYVNVHDADNI